MLKNHIKKVTILILIDGFLQYCYAKNNEIVYGVIILILIDGFLQCDWKLILAKWANSHNPYFNRWFSAIY